ncbi:MarR family winged helix-turn-helix transcriptional regulator [Kineococcus sp. SYSU DK003]|uniref:MarR family winged helix-turn-helix transcriptional regulator n=1 Tax=Kineococcus sp. SYSU DK003 TaxID=3383124 RepID=UPI003D7D7368
MPPADTASAPAPGTGSDTGPAARGLTSLDQLAVELRISLLRTARRLRAQKSLDELTDGQFSVLAQLFTQGPRTPGELAEAEHVRPPSMTRTIAGLVEAGLVARTDHPDDGRQVLISVTDAGRTVVEDTRARRAAWLSRRLETLSEAERATLAEAARILRTVISE